MNNGLKISVTKTPRTDGLLACRGFTLREKLLMRLLGPPRKLMILVPGDSVEEVTITELRKEAPNEAV